ncbi:MAG: hypothetical protein H0Z39_09430 [Peptococcaceae bacterium]|nr:hypothetical protein [Peptococcaceae bacterium]
MERRMKDLQQEMARLQQQLSRLYQRMDEDDNTQYQGLMIENLYVDRLEIDQINFNLGDIDVDQLRGMLEIGIIHRGEHPPGLDDPPEINTPGRGEDPPFQEKPEK